MEERLRFLRGDPTAWHVHDTGQFSLAGAQAKTALYFDPAGRRWGEPRGATPTTHILKPAVTGLDDHDLNEHLCLVAAGESGLQASVSRVLAFGAERVVVVERYDRVTDAHGAVARLHQEDLCQALGVSPTDTYQSDGGPSPETVIGLLRRAVRPTVVDEMFDRFTDALAFNWIIGGTDAHAKNYSLVLQGRQVGLAPLYDVASVLPYGHVHIPKARMAMRIGGEYRLDGVAGRHWRRFAVANGLPEDRTLARVGDLVERVPGAFAAAARTSAVVELGSGLPDRLAQAVARRAEWCRRALES